MSIPESATERIHLASLEILDNPGIKLQHDETLHLFLKQGARPGADNQTVRIPREMVAETLRLWAQLKVVSDYAAFWASQYSSQRLLARRTRS